MTSKEVAAAVGVAYETISRLTKKAASKNLASIEVRGEVFLFAEVYDARGRSYDYTPFEAKKPLSRERSLLISDIEKLSEFDLSATKHTKKEKLLMIAFIRSHNYSLSAIIQGLSSAQGLYLDDRAIESTVRKIQRWNADFRAHGGNSLEDKRGAKCGSMAVDEQLLTQAIYGAGARGIRENYYGVHRFYAYLVQRARGETDMKLPDEIVNYTTLVRAIKRLLDRDRMLASYWKKGKDGILQDYVVGIKDIAYTNQEWQVDATRFDFMCHFTDTDGVSKIKRLNLTAVIDVHTGNAVGTLTNEIDSYAQVRALHKAFTRMGTPEQVYRDNGRDYDSAHYSGVLESMGIAAINAQVGQGRQKGKIERFFGVIQTALAHLPGYIGNDVAKRARIENQTASKIDIRTSKATRINPARLLSAEELQTIIDNTLSQMSADYAGHREHLMDTEALESARRMLGKRELRTLQNDGVRYGNIVYQGVSLWECGLGAGAKVWVYEDIDDINSIYVYSDDDRYVGIARNREMGADAMSLEEHKRAKKAQRAAHITPALHSIADSAKLYEQFQDAEAANKLRYVPAYAKPKPTPAPIPKEKEVNELLEFVLSGA